MELLAEAFWDQGEIMCFNLKSNLDSSESVHKLQVNSGGCLTDKTQKKCNSHGIKVQYLRYNKQRK